MCLADVRGNVNISNNTVAIILAAGKSKRLGEPKALIKLGEKTLIQFIIERLKRLNLKTIVVTNSNLVNQIKNSIKSDKITIIIPENTDYRTGNLIAGLANIKTPERILVVPIDRPGWSLKTVKKLLSMNETCCPEFKGKGGHPLLICNSDIETLINASRDTPLNSLFETKRITVDDPELHLNIDTKKDVVKLNRYFEKSDLGLDESFNKE